MKSGLVVKLIEAHSSGSEDAFKKAVAVLADDEEKKGNSTTALLLRNAYVYKKTSLLIWQIALCLKCPFQRKVPSQCLRTKIAR